MEKEGKKKGRVVVVAEQGGICREISVHFILVVILDIVTYSGSVKGGICC